MKRPKFSEAQIAFALKQAENGTTVGEGCRNTGTTSLVEQARIKDSGARKSPHAITRQLDELSLGQRCQPLTIAGREIHDHIVEARTPLQRERRCRSGLHHAGNHAGHPHRTGIGRTRGRGIA